MSENEGRLNRFVSLIVRYRIWVLLFVLIGTGVVFFLRPKDKDRSHFTRYVSP